MESWIWLPDSKMAINLDTVAMVEFDCIDCEARVYFAEAGGKSRPHLEPLLLYDSKDHKVLRQLLILPEGK